jgi:hypothetical protein
MTMIAAKIAKDRTSGTSLSALDASLSSASTALRKLFILVDLKMASDETFLPNSEQLSLDIGDAPFKKKYKKTL